MLTFIFHIVCLVGGFILLLFLILLLYVLLTPIILKIDTKLKLYIITFPGGRIHYQEFDGEKGIEYIFLHKRGFYSFGKIIGELLKREKEEEEEETRELFEEEEKSKGKSAGEILKILSREQVLIKKVLKRLFRFLKDLLQCIAIERIFGTFSIKDPYYFGLCCAVLCPLTRRNFSLIPNLQEDNYLLADLFIPTGKVVWRLIGFLLSLPLIKIYKLIKELTENPKKAKTAVEGS